MINFIKKVFLDPVSYLGGIFLFYFSSVFHFIFFDVMVNFLDPFLLFNKKNFIICFIFSAFIFLLGMFIFYGLKNYKKWAWIISYFLFPLLIFIFSINDLNFLKYSSYELCSCPGMTDDIINCGKVEENKNFKFILILITIFLLSFYFYLVGNKNKYGVKSNLFWWFFTILFLFYLFFMGWGILRFMTYSKACG